MTSLPNVNTPDPNALNPLEAEGNWNEPKTPYGKVKGKKIKKGKGKNSTLYPFNKVYESESGHVIEVDDTPGSERLHQFHRSGTFTEIHPNGDSVTKVVRDNYTSILRDDYVHIDGHCNITVDKALKILVNNDKGRNTPGKSTNFDIEVGQNANINILVNKGNCQLRLKNGDANVLIDRGDVNIRQEAGNYNHFVNGDYNLEVAGHMHVVVGEDYVNEIGGSRDVRVDGLFDNLQVTTGYQETVIPLGNQKITIGLNKEELILGEYYQSIALDKISIVNGVEEKTVGGLYSVKTGILSFISLGGVSIGNEVSGMDIDVAGNVSMTSTSTINFNTPILSVVALESLDLLSTSGRLNLTGGSVDILSATNANITSVSTNLLSSGTILQTAPVIHLNGPSAAPAITANSGILGETLSRLVPPTPPLKPFIYSPGSIGVWRKTVNGITPLVLVRTSVATLKTQLAVLDTAANTVGGLKEQTNGLVNSLKSVTTGITDTFAAAVSPITQTAATVADTANQVADDVNNVVQTIEDVAQSVVDTIDEVTDAALEPIKQFLGPDGPLGQIKSALGAVTGFISDVINTIADIACAIIDAIASLIQDIINIITEAIAKALEALGSILDAIASIINKVMAIIAAIIKAITDIIAAIFDAVGEFIDGVIGAIAGIFDGLGGRPGNCGLSLGLSVGGTSVGLATGPGGTGIGIGT